MSFPTPSQMRAALVLWLLCAGAFLAGCPDDGAGSRLGPDATIDSGRASDGGSIEPDVPVDGSTETDVGAHDSGTTDALESDAGAFDSGAADAGGPDGATDGGADTGDPVVPVSLTETDIAIRTHVYEQFLTPFPEGHALNGYSQLDWSAFNGSDRVEELNYRAVVLENEYVALTLLPRLGGRIWRWQNKVTGNDEFYVNPAGIKPCHFSYLGWWLATGGIEFSFPVEEHGYVFSVPWDYETARDADGSASIREWVADPVSGLALEVTLTLRPLRADWEMEVKATNPTQNVVSYQLWLNAMLAPAGGGDILDDTTFVYPTDTMIVHGGDPVLGQPRDLIPWPVHNGMDLSEYATWLSEIDGAGLFAKDNDEPFVGSWVPSKNEGVVRVFDKEVPRGVKLWSFGSLKPGASADYAYSTPPTTYFEIWGGVTESFFEFSGLLPGDFVRWKERWAAPTGMGGLSRAGEDAAVHLDAPATAHRNEIVKVVVGAVPFGRAPNGNVTLRAGGTDILDLNVDLSPDKPMLTEIEFDTGNRSPGTLELELIYTPGAGLGAVRHLRTMEILP